VYTVAFDLLIGASWDGSAGAPYGPDTWYFSANGTRLVDATFSNLQLNYNAGAYSPQTYSVAHHTNPATDPLVPNFTGAAAFYSVPGSDYAVDYSIYYFSHGTGNPVLQFTATGSSALLQFARYGNTYDSSDEYWALDNVVVTGQAVPEPTAFTLLASAGLSTAVVALVRRRRHRVAGLRVVKAA
jgi:hypothetical protein